MGPHPAPDCDRIDERLTKRISDKLLIGVGAVALGIDGVADDD